MKNFLTLIFCVHSKIIETPQPLLQTFRPNDENGLKAFEPPKPGSVEFTGFKARLEDKIIAGLGTSNLNTTDDKVRLVPFS